MSDTFDEAASYWSSRKGAHSSYYRGSSDAVKSLSFSIRRVIYELFGEEQINAIIDANRDDSQ